MREDSGRRVTCSQRARDDVCEVCMSPLNLQVETLKFNFSEKSCACIKKLLVTFGTFFFV